MELFKASSEWIIGFALLLNLLVWIPAIIAFRAKSRAKSAKIEMLENILALMPGHVYWVDAQGFYLGCNDNQAKAAGLLSRKDIVGKKNKDLPWNFNAGVLPVLDRINQEVIQTGKPILLEEPAILEDGSELIFLSNSEAFITNGISNAI